MTDSRANMPPPLRELSRRAAIVGIGETDYGKDYRAQRANVPGYKALTVEGLGAVAFERALADSGLSRDEIDGIAVSFTYGGPTADAMAETLGVTARYSINNGNIMTGPLPVVCADIAAGKANTVAMIFAVASRSMGRQFGGATHNGEHASTPSSYYFYHPWGWSSQAAHWAFIFRFYQARYGVTEEDLGAVAVQLRRNAILTPHAVMQEPISIEDYMASRYIVRPLHLLDMCLVNDGAVCLIVRRSELLRGLAKPPVLVAGWGKSKVKNNKLHYLVREQLRPQMAEASAQAFAMAGLRLSDVPHFECYDPASIHLINQIEGYGFFAPGSGVEAFKSGEAAPGGRVAVNTAGGMMSGSYMQGWNHVAECVRQLRGDSGSRQVRGASISMSSLCETDSAYPLIYTRED